MVHGWVGILRVVIRVCARVNLTNLKPTTSIIEKEKK